MTDTRNGAERIADERLRQIMAEGFTTEHDDGHIHGELATAAACYAAQISIYEMVEREGSIIFSDPWPFEDECNKRPRSGSTVSTVTRIRLLEKAGALIAAEIDRLLRKRGT